jgi:hypothetical protein
MITSGEPGFLRESAELGADARTAVGNAGDDKQLPMKCHPPDNDGDDT